MSWIIFVPRLHYHYLGSRKEEGWRTRRVWGYIVSLHGRYCSPSFKVSYLLQPRCIVTWFRFFFTYYGILLKTHKTFIFILLAVVMLSARLQFRKHFFINNKNNTLTTNGSGLLSFVTKVTSTLLLSKYLMWHQGYLRYVLMGIMLFALLGFTKQINISNSHVCFSTSTNSTYKQSISSWNRLMLRIIMLQQTSCRSRIHGDVVVIIAKEFMHNCCQYRR